MQRVSLGQRWRTMLGIAFAIGGVIVLLVGWSRLEGETNAAIQLTYVFSGGLTGMILVAAGGGLVFFDEFARTRRRMDDLEEEVLDLIQDLREDLGVARS